MADLKARLSARRAQKRARRAERKKQLATDPRPVVKEARKDMDAASTWK
jgi:hypothetical protein